MPLIIEHPLCANRFAKTFLIEYLAQHFTNKKKITYKDAVMSSGTKYTRMQCYLA